MAWLYIPSAYVPESEASNSESPSLSIIGERLSAASATWRGKPLQPQAWSRQWKRGGFIRLLSGPTLPLSTLDHGAALFISSLREIPARITASPAAAQDLTGSASLPPRLSASPKSAGLILSSARTCRGTPMDSLRPSSQHWRGWATALRQEYSARPKPATPCDESDCSSWPSAKTSTGKWQRDQSGNIYPTLEGAATEWMAPNVPNGGRTASHAEQVGNTLYHGDKKVQLGLEHQVKHWAAPMTADARGSAGVGKAELPNQAQQWPGPAARDFKGVNREVPTPDYNSRPLNEVAADFRPPSSQDQPIAGGSMSSTDGPNSNQPSVKRKLNPIFVEALMRWPTGLSGFERQEMAWTRWWQLMPSFLSALYSQTDEPAQMEMF
jgi:hypothetical protein